MQVQGKKTKEKKVKTISECLTEITAITEDKLDDLLLDEKDIHYVSEGRFSTHQLVERILERVGPSELILATWAITETPLRTLDRLRSTGMLTSIEGLIERKVPSHNSKAFHYLCEIFDRVDLATCHAKVSLIKSENELITLVTSSNWTVNRRLEVGTISTNPKLYEFHKSWMDGLREGNER